MGDDVKVKFGGDFSDVAKGAGDAVTKAGGALSSWWSDFNKSTTASLTSALALSSLFGKLTDSMANTLKYSRGIDDAFKRFGSGKNSEEFQLVARYGAEVGVSMEAVGRTMNYFSKAMDAASKGSEQHRSVLRALKFSEDEVKSGNVSAIEVLRRLSDEYDRTGNEALVAQRAVQLFGLQGEQLSAIYKNGKINIDEFTKSVKVMGDQTVENLAKTEKRIERFKRALADVFGGVASYLGKEGSKELAEAVVIENFVGRVGEGGGTPEQEGRSIGGQIYSELKGDQDAISEAIKIMAEYEEGDWFLSDEKLKAAQEVVKTLKFLQDKENEKPKEQKEGPPLLQAAKVMAASSLQEIGGGDINSVLSGTYQSSMLDAANKTADNTAKLVQESGKPSQTKPVNVAK
jgi:hypothetical protein